MTGNGAFGWLRRCLIRHPTARLITAVVLILAAIGVVVGDKSPDTAATAAEPGHIPTAIPTASAARGKGAFRRFLRWCTRHPSGSGVIAVLVVILGVTGGIAAAGGLSHATYYTSCAAVRAAGAAPLYRGQPGYRPELDGDDNGVACQSDTRSPASTSGGVYYSSCAAVRRAGAAPLYRGQPGYRAKLDGDHNGIACQD